MKKILLIIFIALSITSPVFATDNRITIQPTPTPVAPIPVGYTLPYPGLLPGNPLYDFKVVRDKVVELFITDPLKKSEFYLLSADKHLSAGIMLADQGRFTQSEQMISKGENYLVMSFAQAQKAKQATEATDEILNTLDLSTQKHQEVIKTLLQKAPESTKPGLENDLKRAQDLEKSVTQAKIK